MAKAPPVWQVSGGPRTRSYVDTFLRHGVALIGPGDAGPWEPGRSDDEFNGSFVRRFVTALVEGDAILLRSGQSSICAVGLVAGGYEHLSCFDDVKGWDLQHARRVRWCPLPVEYELEGKVFGANPPRLSRIRSEEVARYVARFLNSPPIEWQDARLPDLPAEVPELVEIPAAQRAIVTQAADLYSLLWDRERFGEHPTEDELVAHFVVPLLGSLGWRPEQIAVKWRYIDVALFTTLPRTPESCHLVIEAKRLGAGVEGALEQATGYVAHLGVRCDVMVTDGIRYRLYAGERDFEPIAYANLARLKEPARRLFELLRRP